MFSFICDGNLKKAVWDGQRSLGRRLGGHNRASNVALQAKY